MAYDNRTQHQLLCPSIAPALQIFLNRPGMPLLPAVFIELVGADQHLTGLRTVRGPENPGIMQLIDDARRSTIADAELALEKGR